MATIKDTMKPPMFSLNVTSDVTNISSPSMSKRAKPNPGGGRQSFSCAECRRLKLKCSRVWPCASCEKRGCAQICPDGQMKTGKGKRLILADTEELHHRIAQLELALAQAHAKTTPLPHPLLNSPYLFSPRDQGTSQTRIAQEAALEVMSEEEDNVDGGLGVLTISAEGEARYVGSFAGSEYLKEAEGKDGHMVDFGLATPPPSAIVPDCTALNEPERAKIDELRDSLPPFETEGRILAESYWENVNWMYQILPRPMFDSDHLVGAYDPDAPFNAHKVACVYLVMAVGAMFDLNRPPYDDRARELYNLGRSCLEMVELEHASPATVQALHLCGTFILNDKGGEGAETFWPMLGSAVKIAQSLGLHRDGTAFGLSSYEVAERRQVWWEIITYDRLQALCFGRPCATSNKTADTQTPDGDPQYSSDTDGYHRAKYRLITMIEKVIDIQTQTSPVSIQQVNLVDKEFREFGGTVPQALLPHTKIKDLPLDPSVHPHLVIHRLGLRLLISQSRLLLNRPFFAIALGENPSDPAKCRFGDSFVGTYESAQDIVQLVKQLVIYHPSLISRWWFFWFHAFTASVCLAAITIRAPGSAFASPAFHGMTAVYDISAAAAPGCRAKKGLAVLRRLRARASQALSEAGKTQKPPAKEDENDDLNHLHSPTRLRRLDSSQSKKEKSSPMNESPSRDNQQSPYSPQSVATSATLIEPLHYDPISGSLFPMTTTSGGTFGGGAVEPPPMNFPRFNMANAMPINTTTRVDTMSIQTGTTDGWSTDESPFSRPATISLEANSFNLLNDRNAHNYALSYGSYNTGLQSYGEVNFHDASPDETEFNIDMFINQLGGGELGLEGNWL